MRNLLNIIVTVLLLAGSYSAANAQEEPKYSLWMSEGRGCLEGNFGKEHRDEAIKWFRRVKRRCFFNKNIRGQAMRGIADYQLYKGDTASAIKTLRQVIGKHIAHKIETGNAGKIRKRNKEEWNRYYAACKLTEIYLDKKEFAKSRLFLGYVDSTVHVTWICGIGSMGHDMYVEENMLRYLIGIGQPEDAYAYRYGRFFLEDLLFYPENSQKLDSLVKYDLVAPASLRFVYNHNKVDSLILKSLLRKYTKQTLRQSFDGFCHNIHTKDTVMDSGLKVRIYYSNFLGKQIRITAWISDEKGTPITPEQDTKHRKEAELLVVHSWIYKQLEQ